MNFADKLYKSISRSQSVLCAGIDPNIEQIPRCYLELAAKDSQTDEEFTFLALKHYLQDAISTLYPLVAAIKPNIAFFERYGVAGLRALQQLLVQCRDLGIPSIADAKRGDIGSTAAAYSAAFLGQTRGPRGLIAAFNSDALTVNPFLGFDTIEPFIKDCETYGKGIFVLTRTSNLGSGDLQSICDKQKGKTATQKIAEWLESQASRLSGEYGLSGLGAVAGATYPEELGELRQIIKRGYFLIPGFGAQGGKADDIAQGFLSDGRGAIVNASRGLFADVSANISAHNYTELLAKRAADLNQQLNTALAKKMHGHK